MRALGTKEFTVQQVIDAIEENGLDHLRGAWIDVSDGKLTGACVLGQGAINLKVIPSLDALESLFSEAEFEASLDDDHEIYTIQSQLNRFENISEKWEESGESCGDAIIQANDERVLCSDNHYDGNGNHKKDHPALYVLPTYKDVVDMVKEVLAPYTDRTVTLTVMDYKFG